MNSIQKSGRINRDELSEEFYFQALLEKACSLEMLSMQSLEKVQLECLAILAKQTELYNKGNSSSVRIETAKDILDSIMFTIGTALKTYPVSDDAVAAVKSGNMGTFYRQGSKQIDVMIKTAKALHAFILRDVFETDNIFYSPTIIDAINGFFKLYDPAFGAHKIHITADYPVYNPMKKKAGIEFIINYLENICYENLFCLNFSPGAVRGLLCGYIDDYQGSVINIYEHVLSAVIGCVLSGANPRLLSLNRPNLKYLEGLLKGKTGPEIDLIVAGAFVKAGGIFSFPEGVKRYISRSLPLIARSIEVAEKNSTLKSVFIIPEDPAKGAKLCISPGEKMDDELYRSVISGIMKSRTVKDKFAVISKYIGSLADLEDVLLDAGLSGNEIIYVLRRLSRTEIAVLLKKYPASPGYEISELRTNEQVLRKSLYKYIYSLPAGKQNRLIKISETMQME